MIFWKPIENSIIYFPFFFWKKWFLKSLWRAKIKKSHFFRLYLLLTVRIDSHVTIIIMEFLHYKANIILGKVTKFDIAVLANIYIRIGSDVWWVFFQEELTPESFRGQERYETNSFVSRKSFFHVNVYFVRKTKDFVP